MDDQQPVQQSPVEEQAYPAAPIPAPMPVAPVITADSKPSNGIAAGALVCGILGIVGSFIPVVQYFTLVLAIVGIVLGVKGRQKAKVLGVGSGMATAGMVLGIVSVSLTVLAVICVAGIMGALATAGY